MKWLATLLLLFAVTGAAHAQTVPDAPAPSFDNTDANGVDVTTGAFRFSLNEGTIGSGPGTVTLARYWGNGVWRDNWSGGLYQRPVSGVGTVTFIDFGGTSDSFTQSGGVFTSREGNGARLSYNASVERYTYVSSGGTQIQFDLARAGIALAGFICPTGSTGCGIPRTIIEPTGLVTTLAWDEADKCVGQPPSECRNRYYYRFKGVSNNAGFGFTLSFESNDAGDYDERPAAAWFARTGVAFTSSGGCPTAVCPTVSYSGTSPLMLTDALGRTWRFSFANSRLTGIKRPGSTVDSTTISYDANGRVSQVVRDGVTTGYAYTATATAATMTVTDANAGQLVIVTDLAKQRPTQVTDPLNRVTLQTYDAQSRPIERTWPEGNKRTNAFDARGNLTSVTMTPKPGSGLAPIVVGATFPASCTNAATCNKPTATTDARGAVTDFVYDPATGQPTSITRPAPATGGVRPEVRYSYTPVSGVSMPTGISHCRTGASCAGTADEVRTTIGYTAKLLPNVVTTGGGDGLLTATTTLSYDAAGNTTTIDGPLAGADDITRMFYNADRETIGMIGPDPDGAGTLKNRAQRITYNAAGQVTLAESGTTIGQSDAAWAAFTPLERLATAYDANARKRTDTLQSGSTSYALSHYSYDLLGRLDCSATRMNSALWGSLPGSACTAQTAGSFGPDRIAKTIYNAASEVIRSVTALGTADEADEATLTYTPNGRTATLKDGNGNLTTYEHDGFDRSAKTRFPSPSMPGTSSTTDYEELSYDAGSNVTQRRLRDGTAIVYSYDALNRPTLETVAASPYPNDVPVFMSYDLLGRVLELSDGNGHFNRFTYDALGRRVSEQGTWTGVKTMGYDLAGRQTRLSWQDGFYADYDRLVTGEVSRIRENGATSGVGVLATYAYDDLGRRTGVVRGNGTTTNYGYDPVSRLTALGHDVANAARDVSWSYSYTPASQLATTTRSNDAFAYGAFANADVAELPDGLNRLVTQGATALAYDARGNVSGIGTTTYGYDRRNRLATTSVLPGGNSVYSDPAGRLSYIHDGTATTLFGYAGDAMVEEYRPSLPYRRYVPGPGVDETLVWYEGSDRRWLHADERGSTVAVSDSTGTVTSVLSYDEYGTPAATNTGRFQYTGQAWLPELNLAYYKARMYNPRIGRFMQTDPIGYAGGINLYAYVSGDPVNATDPSGLTTGSLIEGPEGLCGACAGFSINFQNGRRPTDDSIDGDWRSSGSGTIYHYGAYDSTTGALVFSLPSYFVADSGGAVSGGLGGIGGGSGRAGGDSLSCQDDEICVIARHSRQSRGNTPPSGSLEPRPNYESRNPFAHFDPQGRRDLCKVYQVVTSNNATLVAGGAGAAGQLTQGAARTTFRFLSGATAMAEIFLVLWNKGMESAGAGCDD